MKSTITEQKEMKLIDYSNQFFNDSQNKSKYFDDDTLKKYLSENSKLTKLISEFRPKEDYSITKQHNIHLDNEVERLVNEKYVKFFYKLGDKESPNSWNIYLNVGSYIQCLEKHLGEIKILFSRKGVSFYYKKSEWFENKLNQIKHSSDNLNYMNKELIMMEEIVNESIKRQIPKFIKFINKSTNGNLDENGNYILYSGFSKYFNRSLITDFFINEKEYKIFRSYIMGKFNLITKSEFRNFINSKNFEFRGILDNVNSNQYVLRQQLFS